MKKHIVVIENNPEILEVIQCVLEGEEYVVTGFNEFPSMKELVRMYADCFIINEWLPGVSGHAICLMLKASVQTRPIPVILSSMSNQSDPGNNICEADAFLKMPFEIEDLVHVVSSLLNSPVPFY